MTGRPSFQRQLEELQRDMVAMGTRVEEVIQQAVTALLDRDQETARQIIAGDDYFDQRELELERRCLSLVALQQPVASDLRLLGAALKIITDLERMADHAQAIAKSTLRLGTEPFIKPLIDIPLMARLARG
ncbi:MAG TPA: PhoU domain-containing protein, partial [Sphingobacteriaceae bacterium]|nr:PhoU domain-containing protein [Sphingobacteriaceae bacterium]